MHLSRRAILAGTAASFTLFVCAEDALVRKVDAAQPALHQLGVYITIGEDNRILFTTPNAEMGQGTFDALARMMAEELDASWEQIDIALSGRNAAMFNPKIYGQTTGGSLAIQGFGPVVRKAGAAARHMLRQAAAERLGVAPDAVTMRDGTASANGKTLTYGELAEAASQLEAPKDVALKSPEEFRLIGKPYMRKEVRPKTTGEARFSVDVDLPNMAVAALAMPEEAWGKIKTPEGLDALKDRDDILAVAPVTGGFAVIAEDFWTAKSAVDTLTVEVELTKDEQLSSSDIDAAIRSAVTSDKAEAALFAAVNEGEDLSASRAAIAGAFKGAAEQMEMLYSVPVWVHGALEPLSATALLDGEKLTLWAPSQNPKATVEVAAKAAGLKPSAVTLERTFIGGGFGRKWNTDFTLQAVEAAIALPGRPVKVIWTREQDTQHDFYRPQLYGSLKFGLDADGNIAAMSNTIAGQSIGRVWSARYNPAAPDYSMQNNPAYRIQSAHLETRPVDLPVPIGWWRSVSHQPTAFFYESALDELAARAGKDPFAYRLAHLDEPRGRRVLETLQTLVVNEEGAIGIAYSDAYGGYTAAAISVSLEEGYLQLNKIWAVADVGLAIDPDNVKAQIKGGIYFGLGPTLEGETQIENAVVVGNNLGDIGALTPTGAPPIDVTLIDNPGEAPAGVGEIGTPLIAPALCNAIVAAGGPRIRTLPVSKSDLQVQI
ncbi:MAG: molybdopterin cofactor-binding domain-containing protein [Pseudomonadota bacterium]